MVVVVQNFSLQLLLNPSVNLRHSRRRKKPQTPPAPALLFNYLCIYEDSFLFPFNTLKVEKLSELRLKTGSVGVRVGQRARWQRLVHGRSAASAA